MYGKTFRDQVRDGVRSSAAVVAPLALDHLKPATVVDVGCGEGWWAGEFRALGCDVTGIDRGCENLAELDRYISHDLNGPLPDDLGTFDLAVCLEVAEHLPASRADGLIADLCRLAPVVAFSAAIPGQRGVNHLNEQWPGYWAARFGQHGYAVSGELRWAVWGDDRVEPWYRQNLLIAAKTPTKYRKLFPAGKRTAPLDVVHPTIFTERCR